MTEVAVEEIETRKRLRRIVVIGCAAALLVCLFILLLPTIVSRTGLRDLLLASAMPPNVSASCNAASIGWFSPLDASDISVADTAGRWRITATGASSEKTLWEFVTNSKRLGEFVIDRPVVTVNVDAWAALPPEPKSPDASTEKTKVDVSLVVSVRDATIQTVARDSDQPNVIAEHVSVTAKFQRAGESETLTIDPGKPLDHAQLSPEMCQSLLKYVAPVVSNTAWTEGAVSAELAECVIPIDRPYDSVVSGKVTIHSVNVGVREGVGQQVTQLVATLTKKDIPTQVRLADESQVSFVVADGVVSHQGLAFGLPEISDELVIETHGSVGFDKQLDLEATIPLPFHMLGDGVIAQALGSETLYVPIKGTLDSPEIRFDSDGQIANLVGKVANPLLSGETSLDDLLSGLRQWRDQRRSRSIPEADGLDGPEDNSDAGVETGDDTGPTILDRIRERRRRRFLRRNRDE